MLQHLLRPWLALPPPLLLLVLPLLLLLVAVGAAGLRRYLVVKMCVKHSIGT